MSLYTPVFPSFHRSNSARKPLSAGIPTTSSARQQSYVEFLRDVHLFLATQSDVLSPPSRPNSPSSDHRVQILKEAVQEAFDSAAGEPSSGKWTRVSQMLKLGCMRGRYSSVSNPCPPEGATIWILPDEEAEWIEWEKNREEDRRRKDNTKALQQIGSALSVAHDSQQPKHASRAELSHPNNLALTAPPLAVSPTTLLEAKEKVRKWQAAVTSEAWRDTARGSSPASTSAVITNTAAKGKAERPRRSRTLDFAVVKPAATSVIGGKGKGSLSRPAVRGSSDRIHTHRSKSPKPSNLSIIPEVSADSGDVEKVGSTTPLKTLPVADEMPKIADFPETPYLPPSFPSHLETSTPLPESAVPIHAKPPPILPLPPSSSTPPLLTPPVNLRDDRTSIQGDLQPAKRPRAFSMSLDGVPNDPPVTPPAKRLRTISQDGSTSVSHQPRSMLPNGGLDMVPSARGNARERRSGAAPPHGHDTDSQEIGTDGKFDEAVAGADAQVPLPSPAKSVKSYFSAPDSDPSDSPAMKPNLLLDSPVSPMLSFAQNPSRFLPQYTSTQLERNSPTMGGMGYSSQFDVERHVDRVSELLEKDIDFDGWLRTVESSQE